MFFYTLLVFSVLSTNAQNVDLNNKCTFGANKQILTCEDLEETSNPGDIIGNSTYILVIKKCNHLKISPTKHELDHYKHLTSYQIVENNILEVAPFAFRGLSGLRYVTIRRNRWDVVRNDTFYGLRELELLSIEDNGIVMLESGAFTGLFDLITLEITRNKFKVLPKGVFASLGQLTSLIGHHNEIEEIEIGAFDGLSNLNLLDLSYNKLKVLNADTYNGLRKMRDLYLGFNEIEEIRGQLWLGNLKFFYLQNNRLQQISINALRHCRQLKQIDVSGNDIVVLNAQVFKDLPILVHLNVRGNPIKDLSSLKTLENVLLTY